MILQTSLVFGQFESTANACCISINPFGRQTLMSQGFIERDRSTRLYFLGVEFLALGAKSANRRDIQSLARGSLATLAKLSGELETILKMPDVKKRLAELGAEPGTVFGPAFGQFMADETTKWGKLVKASGATVD